MNPEKEILDPYGEPDDTASAELKAGQKDEDSLPPYPALDAILRGLIERDLSAEELMREGFDDATVNRIWRLLEAAEYKRRQAPVGIRVTHRSFGKDWRYPITSKFNETARPEAP